MGAPYFRFAIFYRGILEQRGLDIPDVQKLCIKRVKPPRHYRFMRGERIPESLELKHMEKRLNFNTPEEVLLAEDKYGRPIKDNQLNLGIREKAA